jgi:hypothetical protein
VSYANIGTIEIDTNGDGMSDTILESDINSPEQIIQELQAYINTLDTHRFVKKSLLWRVKIIERLIERDRTSLVERQIHSFERTVKVYARYKCFQVRGAQCSLSSLMS